jgi:serine protease Do
VQLQGTRDGQRTGGTGFIIDHKGTLLTNAHVIDNVTDLRAVFMNDERLELRLIGLDRAIDIALMRVQSSTRTFTPVLLGNASAVEPGEIVVAIGNTLDLGIAISAGIVSAVRMPELIQTDAAINIGNSGGPLANMDGEVIGVNTVTISTLIASGIGFAIAIDRVRELMPYLEAGGELQVWRGATLAHLSEEHRRLVATNEHAGVVLLRIEPKSEVDGKLRVNDVIINANGRPISSVADFYKAVSNGGPSVVITVSRNSKQIIVKFPPARR